MLIIEKSESDENIKSLLEKLPLYVDLKSFKQDDGTPISGFSVWDDSFYNDTVVQDNSIATDIFINKSNSYLKDDCLIEINPEKTEFLSIDNTVGNSTKGILIGDYKLEKVENQKLRKLGIMETPNLEDKIEEQAF